MQTGYLTNLFRLARYFWPQIRRYRGLVLVSMITLFAEVGLRLLEPWPLKLVFDRLLPSPNAHAGNVVGDLSNFDAQTVVILAALGLVLIASLRALASYTSTINFARIGNRILATVRNQLYRHV